MYKIKVYDNTLNHWEYVATYYMFEHAKLVLHYYKKEYPNYKFIIEQTKQTRGI